MDYFFNAFTGTTWQEFRQAGASVSGFPPTLKFLVGHIKPGDVFLCYLTGVMRWVGALEIVGPSQDRRRIWKDHEYPVRFDIRSLVMLNPENGVPMSQLEGRVSFFAGPKDRGKFQGIVRRSGRKIKREDAQTIMSLLGQAQQTPVSRPVDPKKLARKPFFRVEAKEGKTKTTTLVSVPEPDQTLLEVPAIASGRDAPATQHTEIQYELLTLGAEMGLDVWVARNDRSRTWNGTVLGATPRLLSELPLQFDEVTTRTIELIDVLWLSGNSIAAAFEVECTTAVYSGLLRMSDLLALQPNLQIDLFLAAPDERREKVRQEIMRPSFNLRRERPLSKTCGFIPFSKLLEKIKIIRGNDLVSSQKPDFVKKMAEYFGREQV